MGDADLDQVVEIEKASFKSPWKRAHFHYEIHDNRWARNPVVRRGDEVLGYASSWMIREELKINNIVVRRDQRRRGLGEWLLRFVLREARDQGCRVARLEVRPSNTAALALYRRHGFSEIGRRKEYYRQDGEDAVVMEAIL